MILIKGKLYDKLKFFALVILPALGTLYFALAGIWGLPAADQVVGTIVCLDAFLGTVLQLSSTAYARSDAAYDGDFVVEGKPGGGTTVRLELSEEPEQQDLEQKDELRFKVKKVQEVQKARKRRTGTRSRRKPRL
jgi:hypothetical protein